MAYKWFRAYHGAALDPKYILIARAAGTGVTPGMVAAVWWAVMDHASQNDDRGCAQGLNLETLAAFYGWPLEQIENIYAAMMGKGMIDPLPPHKLTNWDSRQPLREDKTAAERKRRQRQRQREANVTQGHGKSHTVTRDRRDCHAESESLSPSVESQSPESESEGHGDFDEFWSLYPRKVGKGQARKAWSGALRKASAGEIILGVRRAAEAFSVNDPRYIPYPATWLNGERWLDEIPQQTGGPINGTEAPLTPREQRALDAAARRRFGTAEGLARFLASRRSGAGQG